MLKFQEGASVVIASTRIYVTELNKVERNNYIEAKVSSLEQIKLSEIEEAHVFSAEGLKARLDALSQLASYAELLGELATYDAAERVIPQATSLKDSLEQLEVTLGSLDGNAPQSEGGQNDRFRAAVAPSLRSWKRSCRQSSSGS